MITSKEALAEIAVQRDQALGTLSVGVLATTHFHQVVTVTRNDGTLQIPSGRLKPNEPPKVGAQREFREETGLKEEIDLKEPRVICVTNPNGLFSIGLVFDIQLNLPEGWLSEVTDEDIRDAQTMFAGGIIQAYENDRIFKPEITMRALYPFINHEFNHPYSGLRYTVMSQPPVWLQIYANRY